MLSQGARHLRLASLVSLGFSIGLGGLVLHVGSVHQNAQDNLSDPSSTQESIDWLGVHSMLVLKGSNFALDEVGTFDPAPSTRFLAVTRLSVEVGVMLLAVAIRPQPEAAAEIDLQCLGMLWLERRSWHDPVTFNTSWEETVAAIGVPYFRVAHDEILCLLWVAARLLVVDHSHDVLDVLSSCNHHRCQSCCSYHPCHWLAEVFVVLDLFS